jgi:hypothetical protein
MSGARRVLLAGAALTLACASSSAQHEHETAAPASAAAPACAADACCAGGACPMHAEKHGTAAGCPHCATPGAAAAAPCRGDACEHGPHAGDGMHAQHRAEMAARHATIDRLAAIEDIQQLKARYMRCIDTKDLACLRDTVFTPDAELRFKGADYDIAVRGWPEIEKFYQGAFTPNKFGMHNAHTPEITVSGDTATGIWYLHDVFVNLEENWTLQGSALYTDDYVKQNGAWRISRSTYKRLWEETTPRSEKTRLGSKSVTE